jgi:hypothetical protein
MFRYKSQGHFGPQRKPQAILRFAVFSVKLKQASRAAAAHADPIRLAHAELMRVESLLSCIAFALKYMDSEEEVDAMDCCLLAEMAKQQVAIAVDKLDAWFSERHCAH